MVVWYENEANFMEKLNMTIPLTFGHCTDIAMTQALRNPHKIHRRNPEIPVGKPMPNHTNVCSKDFYSWISTIHM